MKLATLMTTLLALALAIPAIASASVRDCRYPSPNTNYGPRNDREMNGGAVSVRNMSCSAALRAITNGYLTENGTPLHTRGFRCYVLTRFEVRTPGHSPFVTGATIRCVSGTRAFRFSWAT